MGIESHRSWRMRSISKCTRKNNDDDDWNVERKEAHALLKLFSYSLWSPPEWRSPSLYTHHPRRILEMIIITQYEYLCSVDRIVKESGAVLQDSSVARRGRNSKDRTRGRRRTKESRDAIKKLLHNNLINST